MRERLIPFVAGSAEDTDVFCFQEVLSVPGANEAGWRKSMKFGDSFAKGTVADGRIFGAMKRTLRGFDSFLSAPYAKGDPRLATFVSGKAAVTFHEIHPLGVEQRQRARGEDIWAKPILQYTRLRAGGRQYNILNFHGLWVFRKWHSDTPNRIEQSQAIMDFIAGLKGRTVLCGDFNLTPETRSLRMLEDSGLRNLVREEGVKSTRTREFWRSRDVFADYVLVSEDVEVRDFGVIDEAVSDHLPLYLDFR